jgi:hypothetical protein
MAGMALVHYLQLFIIAVRPWVAKLPVVIQSDALAEQLPMPFAST